MLCLYNVLHASVAAYPSLERPEHSFDVRFYGIGHSEGNPCTNAGRS